MSKVLNYIIVEYPTVYKIVTLKLLIFRPMFIRIFDHVSSTIYLRSCKLFFLFTL